MNDPHWPSNHTRHGHTEPDRVRCSCGKFYDTPDAWWSHVVATVDSAARADADRLAAAMRAAMAGKPHTKFSELLAAHDAARTKEGL